MGHLCGLRSLWLRLFRVIAHTLQTGFYFLGAARAKTSSSTVGNALAVGNRRLRWLTAVVLLPPLRKPNHILHNPCNLFQETPIQETPIRQPLLPLQKNRQL